MPKKVQVVKVVCGERPWARSRFPHPLVTLDYDDDENLIAVVVVGKKLEVEVDAEE